MPEQPVNERNPISDEQIARLQKLAANLQFGTVTLVFQNGVLIQLERSEKIRLK